jgi:hypothetical protein
VSSALAAPPRTIENLTTQDTLASVQHERLGPAVIAATGSSSASSSLSTLALRTISAGVGVPLVAHLDLDL